MDSERAGKLHDAIDRQFAEAFTILPKTASGNARPKADPGRPTTGFTGVYTAASVSSNPRTPGRSGRYAAEIEAPQPTVTFSTAQLPFTAAKDDMVRREQTGELFAVHLPVPNGFGRVTLRLVAQPGS